MKGAIIVGIQQANWPCTEHCLVPTFPSLLLEMGSGEWDYHRTPHATLVYCNVVSVLAWNECHCVGL